MFQFNFVKDLGKEHQKEFTYTDFDGDEFVFFTRNKASHEFDSNNENPAYITYNFYDNMKPVDIAWFLNGKCYKNIHVISKYKFISLPFEMLAFSKVEKIVRVDKLICEEWIMEEIKTLDDWFNLIKFDDILYDVEKNSSYKGKFYNA